MSDPRLDRATRFGLPILARALLVDAATVLARAGIELMPLKGVLLQSLVFEDPSERPLTDVDVAVRAADFDDAVAALLAAGYRVEREEQGRYEVALVGRNVPLCLDLHRSFSASRRGRLTPDAMFARGRVDAALFGVPVVLPEDADLYAHLLLHMTLDHLAAGRWSHPGDLDRVASARGLDPRVLAARVHGHGLGRVARIALDPSSPAGATASAREVLRWLPRDPLGRLVAMGLLTRGPWRRGLAARGLAVLLNPSIRDVAAALRDAVAARARAPAEPGRPR